MPSIEVFARDSVGVEGSAVIDSRYSFTVQFLLGAYLQSRLAAQIEGESATRVTEEDRVVHRSHVASAVMQSCASLESAISEICEHGPGHHMGSNGVDATAREFLRPLAGMIDKQSALARFDTVLHLLGKPSFARGTQPYQDATLLVKLRNEVVHYKSQWRSAGEQSRLMLSLKQQGLSAPPFYMDAMFFPHQCLSAARAEWAVRTAVAFLDAFFDKLGSGNVLDGYRASLP